VPLTGDINSACGAGKGRGDIGRIFLGGGKTGKCMWTGRLDAQEDPENSEHRIYLGSNM
jgi:hypothetical protein